MHFPDKLNEALGSLQFDSKAQNDSACENAVQAADSDDFEMATRWLNEANEGLEYPEYYNNYKLAYEYVMSKAKQAGISITPWGKP